MTMYAPTSRALKVNETRRPRLESAMLSVQHGIERVQQAVRSPRQSFNNLSPMMRHRIAMLAVVAFCAMLIAAPQLRTHAQSFNIDFGAEDLDVFFTWFNTMFGILLPIALIGAGIVAGGMFVWVVAGMLQRAFTSMLGRVGGR